VELEGIVGRSAFGVRRSAFGVRRSAFGVRRSADCGERIQKASLFLLANAILGGCGTVKPRGFFSAKRLALNAKR
jgi:hypothetical protein